MERLRKGFPQCIDCLDAISDLADGSVDLVLTDPPYRITPRGRSGCNGGFMLDKKSYDGKLFKHNSIDIADYIDGFYRVLKNCTHCYVMCNNSNLPHFMEVVSRSRFKFVKDLIWDKRAVIMGTFYMGAYEHILFLRKGGARRINDCSTPDILRYRIPDKDKDADGYINPTQKPVALFSKLITNSTRPGELVFDPFCGSGTTAVACAETGREFVGGDLDERQVEHARMRVLNVSRQQELF